VVQKLPHENGHRKCVESASSCSGPIHYYWIQGWPWNSTQIFCLPATPLFYRKGLKVCNYASIIDHKCTLRRCGFETQQRISNKGMHWERQRLTRLLHKFDIGRSSNSVASLGLVSPCAVTDGATLPFFTSKLMTFLVTVTTPLSPPFHLIACSVSCKFKRKNYFDCHAPGWCHPRRSTPPPALVTPLPQLVQWRIWKL